MYGRLPFYVDPAHGLHIEKIARGAHLHVTPNPKYSRAITWWIDTHREMHVITGHDGTNDRHNASAVLLGDNCDNKNDTSWNDNDNHNSDHSGNNGCGFGHRAYGNHTTSSWLLGLLAMVISCVLVLLVLPTLLDGKGAKVAQELQLSWNNMLLQPRKSRMTPSHIARNKLDTHADTCCAGSNWWVLWLTGGVWEVKPYLPTYEVVNEIPVTGCGTVWMSPCMGQEYLLVGDQFLYFGTMLPHSLLNPNQIRAFDVDVNDNPFDATNSIGMDCEDAFALFEMMGTMVYFELRVPTDWEIKHLPQIHITGNTWNPMDDSIFPAGKSWEQAELQTIKSLTSGMTRQQLSTLQVEWAKAQIEEYGKVEHELGKILPE